MNNFQKNDKVITTKNITLSDGNQTIIPKDTIGKIVNINNSKYDKSIEVAFDNKGTVNFNNAGSGIKKLNENKSMKLTQEQFKKYLENKVKKYLNEVLDLDKDNYKLIAAVITRGDKEPEFQKTKTYKYALYLSTKHKYKDFNSWLKDYNKGLIKIDEKLNESVKNPKVFRINFTVDGQHTSKLVKGDFIDDAIEKLKNFYKGKEVDILNYSFEQTTMNDLSKADIKESKVNEIIKSTTTMSPQNVVAVLQKINGKIWDKNGWISGKDIANNHWIEFKDQLFNWLKANIKKSEITKEVVKQLEADNYHTLLKGMKELGYIKQEIYEHIKKNK